MFGICLFRDVCDELQAEGWGLGPCHKEPSGSVPTLFRCSAISVLHVDINLCWKVVTTRGCGICPMLALGFF